MLALFPQNVPKLDQNRRRFVHYPLYRKERRYGRSFRPRCRKRLPKHVGKPPCFSLRFVSIYPSNHIYWMLGDRPFVRKTAGPRLAALAVSCCVVKSGGFTRLRGMDHADIEFRVLLCGPSSSAGTGPGGGNPRTSGIALQCAGLCRTDRQSLQGPDCIQDRSGLFLNEILPIRIVEK